MQVLVLKWEKLIGDVMKMEDGTTQAIDPIV
jgi:hypothetical protein